MALPPNECVWMSAMYWLMWLRIGLISAAEVARPWLGCSYSASLAARSGKSFNAVVDVLVLVVVVDCWVCWLYGWRFAWKQYRVVTLLTLLGLGKMHIHLQNMNLEVVSNMHNTSCSSSSNCWGTGGERICQEKLRLMKLHPIHRRTDQ